MDPAVVARLTDPGQLAARQAEAALRYQQDWAELSFYRGANAALEGQAVQGVFLGDSITEMWGQAQPDLFDGGIVNRGISGQTSPQLLVRFMADVVALRPRWLHLMCGINDIAGNTGPSTPQDFAHHIGAMLDLADRHGIAVILARITPVTATAWSDHLVDPQGHWRTLNRWLADEADRRGLVSVDYGPVLADAAGNLSAALTRDGVHMQASGYARMRPLFEAALSAVRQRPDAASDPG